uniref:Uncharacterized protein n=1 Tax=Tanacetum cinerariifolium TaxID=118510 RepID=A0A699GMR3_TANCI|nr:hypothetical protein [Tanacetum cinerariifolium]
MAGDDNQNKNEKGSSGGITYDSPYYLHPSDYPKQLHVNEVLTDNNFADWSQEMTNFLFAKNKIEFVDGTIKKREKTSKDYMSWMRVDAMIKGWLKTAMEKNIRNNVKYAGDASVPTYFTQLRSIWDEAQSIYLFRRCSCNKRECDVGKKINEHQEKERLYEFLMGLDAEFTDERQRAVSNENINPHESTAFKAFQRRNGPPGSNKERSGTKKVTRGLLQTHRYPEWWPGKIGENTKGKAACVETQASPIPGLTNEDYQYFLKHFSGTSNSEGTKPVANMAHKEDEEGQWIFDSGCIEYITYLSNIRVNKKVTHSETPIVIPNEDSTPVKGKEDYILLGRTKVIGVLCVPEFKCNLLSVSCLCRYLQCSVSFFLDLCIMQRLQKRNLIGAGRCRGGLYQMKMIQGRKTMATTIETWHRRFEHASKGKLAKMDFLKTSINDLGFGENVLTAAYVINRLPSKVIKNKTPFELIWNEKPNYDFLKVFGCLVYFKNTNTKGDKFKERGKSGVFLGYPPRTKGYKILDLDTRKIIVSRDVNFHKENFPFKNVQGNNKSGTKEPIICHDCHCHDEPILAKNKEQVSQMDHDQTNEPSDPLETRDGDETSQINDEGQPNNDEFETNKSNEGAEAQSEISLTRTRTQPSRFKGFVVQVPLSVKHPASTSNQVASTNFIMTNLALLVSILFHSFIHFVSSNQESQHEDYSSDIQYAVSIKEDTVYLCLDFTKNHEENKINTPYPEKTNTAYSRYRRMDNPNITVEEYIRLEEVKVQKCGKVFNWEIAKYECYSILLRICMCRLAFRSTLNGIIRMAFTQECWGVQGLHTTEEIAEDGFGTYWLGSERVIPDKGDLSGYWIEISSDRDFLRPAPSYTYIRDLVRRLCYGLISYSISRMGQAPEKVTATDLFYLRSMDREAANISYLLAQYLFRHSERRKSGARLSGGHLLGVLLITLVCTHTCTLPPPPPVAAGRTMPQRLRRLEEEIQGLRQDVKSLHGLVESSITD